MDTTTIAELLSPFTGDEALNPHQLQQICAYLELLMKWNAKTNLTALRDEKNIVIRHFGESLFAARTALPSAAQELSVIDLGSGAGFPGLPLKIYRPSVRLTLIESQNKKATFLKEVVRTLRLEDVVVFNGRGEDCPAKGELVTLRAVEHFHQVLTVAARLLCETGTNRLTLLIGEAQVREARTALPGFAWAAPVAMPLSEARSVLIGQR
jgi:16S rRNA (guanine527-N7)-methyltransferase